MLDTGARGSTVTFAQRGLGDVLPTWENEAYLVFEEFGRDKFDVIVPPTSIYAEPPVALVDANVDKKGTRKQAEAYLQFLYSDAAQAIFAKHHYRPIKREAAKPEHLAQLPELKLFKIEDLQGNWDDIQKKNFDNGGLFRPAEQAGAVARPSPADDRHTCRGAARVPSPGRRGHPARLVLNPLGWRDGPLRSGAGAPP